MKLLTFNIDTNIGRTEEGYARDSFPEWRVNNRMPLILQWLGKIIEEKQPDVIHLQEARKFVTKFGDEVDSLTPLVNFLSVRDYHVKTAQYNPSDKSFSYITAIKLSKYDVVNTLSLYLTKTPEKATDHSLPLDQIKDNNFGEEWERSVFITKFTPKVPNKVNVINDIPQVLTDFINNKVVPKVPKDYINDIYSYVFSDSVQNYYSINVHLSLGKNHRLEACKLITKWVAEIKRNDPTAKIIISGDFNSFPDCGGSEQIAIMKESLYHASEKLQLIDTKEKINWSFIAFPYDFANNEQRLNKRLYLESLDPETRKREILNIFEKECSAICGQLDQVFLYNFVGSENYLIPTTFNNELKEFTEDSVKKYILNNSDGPAFASDHQPVLSILY